MKPGSKRCWAKTASRRVIAITLAAALITSSMPVPAFQLDLGLTQAFALSATVGLDQQTEDFLANTLPASLRAQAIQLIQQALPLIDRSVSAYLAQVSSILDDKIDELQCAGVGVVNSEKDVFQGLVGIKPHYLDNTEKDWTKTRAKFRINESPKDLSTAYGDLDYRVTEAACTVKLAPAAYTQINDIKQDLMPRFFAWWRLQNSCATAAACLTFLTQKVTQDITSADSRDVFAADAANRLAAATKSSQAAGQSVGGIEDTLITLWSIDDQLKLEAYRRNKIAAEAIAAANVDLDHADGLITSARGQLSTDYGVPNVNAKNAARDASNSCDDAGTQLNTATSNRSATDPDIAKAASRLKKDRDQIGDIQAIAQKDIQIVDAKAFNEQKALNGYPSHPAAK